MGQEVSHSHFTSEESQIFAERLHKETHLLQQKMSASDFSSQAPMGGFEVEAWLVDSKLRPAPKNEAFFKLFNNPLATPELAKFNIELNNTPHKLSGSVFGNFEYENWLNYGKLTS